MVDVEHHEDLPTEKVSQVYMELQSTVNFKNFDIDSMLESTNLDDFLKGLYADPTKAASPAINKMVMSKAQTQKSTGVTPNIEFDSDENKESQSKDLRKEALLNLKKKRIEQKKKSRIFLKQFEDQDSTHIAASGIVDLTKPVEQEFGDEELDEIEDMDDYDLLEANIDPFDYRSLKKRDELQKQLEFEELRIKTMRIKQYIRTSEDPFGLFAQHNI